MRLFFLLLVICSFSACIGDDYLDDFVQPELRITNAIDSLAIDSTYQFEVSYFNNVGAAEVVAVNWTSSNPENVSIDMNGLATAHAFGPATITANFMTTEVAVMDEVTLHTSENPVTPPSLETRSGNIMTTSTYLLEGDFLIEELPTGGIKINLQDNYRADNRLPGLYVYLSNNPSSIAQALEISSVTVFEGSHDYEVPDVGINDYAYLLYFCRPFNVEVGNGRINE